MEKKRARGEDVGDELIRGPRKPTLGEKIEMKWNEIKQTMVEEKEEKVGLEMEEKRLEN